jgi:hypothetical protein
LDDYVIVFIMVIAIGDIIQLLSQFVQEQLVCRIDRGCSWDLCAGGGGGGTGCS